jgi:two-component system, NarL family, sensor histidine kinase UhpB
LDHRKRTGMTVHLDIESSLPRLSESAEIALYRIAQEGFTNAVKHSEATTMWLHLGQSEAGIELSLRDDGRGFDPNVAYKGFGLLGMQERAAMLEARLEVLSKRDEGTTILVVMPWTPDSSPT